MLWMVFEMLSSFPRPYFCSRSQSWYEPQIPCQMETRPCFFISSSPVTLPQNCPEYTPTHLVTSSIKSIFLKENREETKHSKGRDWALPCCSRHICRGAPQSEPSCVCSGWKIEKSSSHTLSTGEKKKE